MASLPSLWVLAITLVVLSFCRPASASTSVVSDIYLRSPFSSLYELIKRPELRPELALRVCDGANDERRAAARRKGCRRKVSLQGLRKKLGADHDDGLPTAPTVDGFAFVPGSGALPGPLAWFRSLAAIASRDLSSHFSTPGVTWLARRDSRASEDAGGFPDVREIKELLVLLLSEKGLASNTTVAESCRSLGIVDPLKPVEGLYADPWSVTLKNGQNDILCLPLELTSPLLPFLRAAFPGKPWLVDLRGLPSFASLSSSSSSSSSSASPFVKALRATGSWKQVFGVERGEKASATNSAAAAAVVELATVALFEANAARVAALTEERQRQENRSDDSMSDGVVSTTAATNAANLQVLASALETTPFDEAFFSTMRSVRGPGMLVEWRGYTLKTGERYAVLINSTKEPLYSPLERLVVNGVGQGAVLASAAPLSQAGGCGGENDGANGRSPPFASLLCIVTQKLSNAAGYPSFAQDDEEGQEQEESVDAAASGVSRGSRPCIADLHRLPIGGGYPFVWPLSEILSAWNPDVTALPRHYGRFTSLRAFDATSLGDIEEARNYRRAELPFLLRNAPSLLNATRHWLDDSVLIADAADTLFHVDTNADSAHFMYYSKDSMKRDGSWEPPTGETLMTMKQWLEAARQVEAQTKEEEGKQLPENWAEDQWRTGKPLDLNARLMRASGKEKGKAKGKDKGARWLREPLLEDDGAAVYACPLTPSASLGHVPEPEPVERLERAPRTLFYPYANAAREVGAIPSLDWITRRVDLWRFPEDGEAEQNATGRGTPTGLLAALQSEDPRLALATVILPDDSAQTELQLRWGMPRVIAECHFDSGRNWIGMLKGRRRYILAPPTECGKLSILTEGPYRRHSSLDWTSQEDIAALAASGAKALEIVMEPGDVLYLPPLWFHFIISLETNMQVNSRAGTSPYAGENIIACNISFPVTEPLGLHTSLLPPLHHLAALASSPAPSSASTSSTTPATASATAATKREERRLWSVAEAISIARRAADSEEMEALHANAVPEGTLRKGRMGPPLQAGEGAPHAQDAPNMGPAAGAAAAAVAAQAQRQQQTPPLDNDQDAGGSFMYSRQPDTCQSSAGFISEAQKVPWALAGAILEVRPYEDVGKIIGSVFKEQCYLPTPVPEHIFRQQQGKNTPLKAAPALV